MAWIGQCEKDTLALKTKEHCEEYGRMLTADPACVSARAKKRGLPQLGTLGAGNHYAEIQVIDRIYDKHAAAKMGLEFEVCDDDPLGQPWARPSGGYRRVGGNGEGHGA